MPTCHVYFQRGSADLDSAAQALLDAGLRVVREDTGVQATRAGAPVFRIRLALGRPASEAADAATDAALAEQIRACDARFDVEFADLDEALDEINTLMEVQVALQDLTGGYLFLPWNGSVAGPEHGG
ncbi:hypothetical protein [Rubrivirga sp.]|uniref:hypothetical protein n=1 Tax=Rubrivirga sp. TaxID=1885344 RepID=UPI003B52D6D2